jgi:sodium-dependent dicarboxylate transporter 2/3/5
MTFALPPPEGMSAAAWSALGLMLLMAVWWATEAIPIPATAMLPVILVPALGLGNLREAAAPYADPVIFLFLGGFMLGIAMQRWRLHERIALITLLAVGTVPRRQVAGFMAATAFLSMWVSNTATTIMMLPIGISVIAMIRDTDETEVKRFATALLLAIAYAASIGGIATLIGTPPNALLAGYLSSTHGIQVGFAQWMLMGVPVSAAMLVIAWLWLTRGGFNIDAGSIGAASLRQRLAALGVMSRGEKLVAAVFSATALCWITQPLLERTVAPWISDTTIAITAAVAMFLIPVEWKKREFVMDWSATRDIPWGVLLLFGGGLSLAAVISRSGLADWLAQSLNVFGALPVILMVAVVVLVIIFLTEVTSNTATAAAFLPLLGALAVSQGVSPLLFAVPAVIAASCAFMMPVATPPNAIVFATGHLRIQSMIRAGFALNLAGIVVVTGVSYLLLGWVFTL